MPTSAYNMCMSVYVVKTVAIPAIILILWKRITLAVPAGYPLYTVNIYMHTLLCTQYPMHPV